MLLFGRRCYYTIDPIGYTTSSYEREREREREKEK
jgi:hypothetical protein